MPATDLLRIPAAADRRLREGVGEHQTRILLNYRRHVLLETMGLWQEIFVPEMIVDHPVHRVNRSHETLVLDGREAISEFYRRKAEDGGHVVIVDDERLAVADWGLATELMLTKYVPADLAAAKSGVTARPGAWFRVRSRIVMVWHYDSRAVLTGEHLYEDAASVQIDEASDDQRITAEQARAVLLPVLNPAPPLLV